MKIFTKYQDCLEGKKRGEVPNESTPYYVDCVGFISMEQQIKGLINAGINLENYRRSQYDYQTSSETIDIDDIEVSVENSPDFMPSVDMPLVTDSLLSNIVPSNNSDPVDVPESQGGEPTPSESTNAE